MNEYLLQKLVRLIEKGIIKESDVKFLGYVEELRQRKNF